MHSKVLSVRSEVIISKREILFIAEVIVQLTIA